MKRNLLNHQESWERLVEKVTDQGISSLSKEEKVWFTVDLLIADIENGGLLSFFYNSDGDYLPETLESLEILEQFDILASINKLIGYFPNNQVPVDIEGRNDVIREWSDETAEEIKKICDVVQDLTGKMEETLYDYLETSKLHLQ